jgi:hypothetical protein
MLDGPGMQQWHEEPRPKTEATRQQADKGPTRQTAPMSEKREDIQLDLQENHRQREDREPRSRVLRRVWGKSRTGPCGGVDPSPKRKKGCTERKSR